MKKILGLIVIVLILLLSISLVSCTSGGSSGVQESSEQGDNTPSNNTNSSKYTIIWKDWNNNILEIDEDVLYGTTPTYDGTNPTKQDDDNYTYTFSGWSPSISKVKKNQTYIAQYTRTEKIHTFTVVWKNWDGTTLETDNNVAYGTNPTYNGSIPTKASTTQYSYTFSGWSPTISSVTSDVTYIAQYTSTLKTYTITWKNWNDTILETDENVSYGTTPVFNGNQPTREEDSEYTYTFNGWSPSVSSVSANTIYTAQFTQNRKAKTISFNLNNGTTTSDTSSREILSLDSSYFFFNVTKENYNFRGWSYKGTKVFDQNGNLINNVALENNMVFDAIFIQGVTLTINYTLYEPRTNTRVNTFSTLDGSVGTGSGTRDYNYNTNVDLSVNLTEGYEFIGWYYNGTLLSSETEYNYMMWDEDITLEGRIKYKYYSLNINSNNSSKGLVLIGKSGNPNDYSNNKNGTKYYTESITISAYTKTDTRFLGWYDENNDLVSTNAVYTFTMPNRNYTLEAKWNYFTITYDLNEGTNDSRNPDSYVLEDGNITLYNPTRSGYTFVGWYLDEEKVTVINSQLFKHIILEVRWVYYTLTTMVSDSNAGSVTYFDDTKITAGENVSITATSNTGYTFVGWYNGSTLLTNNATYTFNMPGEDTEYEARFNANTYTVTIDNQASGVTITGAGTYSYGSQVTLTASNIPNGYTVGWGVNGNIANAGSSYTFTMGLDVTVVTTLKLYTRENNVIYFGSFPQTKVTDTTIAIVLNTKAGTLPTSSSSYSWIDYSYYINGSVASYMWYQDISYNGEKYRGVYFTNYRPYYTTNSSSTGNSYQENNGYNTSNVYWFKWEPIKWNILQETGEKALLIADLLLDSQDYYWSNSGSHSHNGGTGYSNNYELSHIRQWLNDTFYNTVFTTAEKSIIQTTNVDNSASSTGNSSNSFACDNTNDKLFLLSKSEITTYFSSDSARKTSVTDYAKCQGLHVDGSTSTSWWWLRSPGYNSTSSAREAQLVSETGLITNGHKVYDTCGVRPVMWIEL